MSTACSAGLELGVQSRIPTKAAMQRTRVLCTVQASDDSVAGCHCHLLLSHSPLSFPLWSPSPAHSLLHT